MIRWWMTRYRLRAEQKLKDQRKLQRLGLSHEQPNSRCGEQGSIAPPKEQGPSQSSGLGLAGRLSPAGSPNLEGGRNLAGDPNLAVGPNLAGMNTK